MLQAHNKKTSKYADHISNHTYDYDHNNHTQELVSTDHQRLHDRDYDHWSEWSQRLVLPTDRVKSGGGGPALEVYVGGLLGGAPH